MTNSEYAAMHGMQPTARQPMPNRPTAEPESGELGPGDDPMLAFREPGDHGVDLSRGRFGPCMGPK